MSTMSGRVNGALDRIIYIYIYKKGEGDTEGWWRGRWIQGCPVATPLLSIKSYGVQKNAAQLRLLLGKEKRSGLDVTSGKS